MAQQGSTAQQGPAETTGIRERFRTQVRDEVKQAALEQLAAGGPQALSVNAIAKQLGVSGPALYRYFAGRDELLTELVIDAYDDLARSVEAALGETGDAPADRVGEFVHAYRAWAVAQPHRYRLLYSRPLPGYDAHSERIVAASQRLMVALLATLPADPGADPTAEPRAVLRDQPGSRLESRLGVELDRWAESRGLDADAPLARRAIQAWARMHGLVSLEIEGNFHSMGLDPAPFYETEIDALLGRAAGA